MGAPLEGSKKAHGGAGSMMSPRTNQRLPYRSVNTPTVPGIRDHYHRPVLRTSGQGAVSIDQSRITIDYLEMLF